jgi:hypothetical protein
LLEEIPARRRFGALSAGIFKPSLSAVDVDRAMRTPSTQPSRQAASRRRVHLPHLSGRAIREWLDQPGHGQQSGPMYTLLLRPGDRRDIQRRP